MNKSFKILACSTMAFAMLTSAALANPVENKSAVAVANAKVSNAFNDLSNIDPVLKAKIDSLLSKGIFEGVSDDTFGIHLNMTRAQFAKVAALVFDLDVDYSITTSSFADVKADDPQHGWAIPYIEAAKKAGLIDGMTDTEFAPGNDVTIGQLDKVFVAGLGKPVNVTGSPWYEDAVRQAQALGIHPPGKDGRAAASRADLVTAAYAGYEAFHKQEDNATPAAIVSVKSVDNKTVQVILNQPVDPSKVAFFLTKDTQQFSTTTKWSNDHKSADLTVNDAELTAGEYTIRVTGLDKPLTATLTVSGTISTNDPHVSIINPGTIANVIDSGLTSAATGLNGFVTRTVAEDPTLSKFAKEIKFNVTNAAGDAVAIPGIIETITSSDPNVVKVGRSNDNRGYVLGNKAGTATVNIVYKTNKGESKVASVTVNVKDEVVAASQVEADARAYQRMTVSDNVYSAEFNAFTAMNLKVYDNYGIKYQKDEVQKYNFALAVVLIADHIVGDLDKGDTGTVTVDPDGTVHVVGNVTQFDITAHLPNNKSATTEIRLLP
ncbi:S-layer homology domain-containing protein [Paenibacillus sp. JMULE4]|uniref:S-layer homology domain-containing protein n=1 Tax=Paenibacillus sp. JMULE4 TaxID=2518342 RepID=UPI0015753FCF|nr:S-layer homology domain-containing protein [Paenibacillus sp. JMULE4]